MSDVDGLTEPGAVAPRMQLGGDDDADGDATRPARPVLRWIGNGLIALGVLLGAVILARAFLAERSDVDDLVRGDLPAATLLLDAGPQTIFLEGDGLTRQDPDEQTCVDCDAAYAAEVAVTTIEGTDVPVARYRGATGYDDGIAVATVDIPRAGRYVVDVRATVGERVAVGTLHTVRLLAAVALAVGVWFVLGVVGGLLAARGRGGAAT